MEHDYDAQRLNLTHFARAAGHLVGELRLLRFERLLELTQGLGAQSLVQYAVRGSLRTDAAGAEQVWLELSAETLLPLVCQRCLGPAEIAVHCARSFRFVASEAQAAAQDEESEEDVLVISKAFNVLELVEDELLMALPLAPMHEQCPTPVPLQVADADFDQPDARKPHPFAVLEQLKKTRAH
ncbi:MAG: YceD family protein [Rhodoferax sp.]